MTVFATPIRPVVRDILSELAYWRNIRLDCPWRKEEALYNINRLLDILHRKSTGV